MASRATQKMHAALSGHSNDAQDENSAARFVHLHVHSAFSLLESALPLKKVMDLAIADNQPALAITDRNNMFGALEFSEKASKDGLQPIMGCKLAISFQDGNDHVPRSGHVEFPYLVFLAMNDKGFANLKKLVSSAHVGCDDGDLPNVSVDAIEKLNSGLICLTAYSEGPINKLILEGRKDDAEMRLTKLSKIFDDRLYVELQRHGNYDRKVENGLIDLAYKHDIGLVATNQPFFPKRDDLGLVFACHPY